MNKALFLDRDGVINVDKGYVYLYEEIVWFEEIFEIIKIANDKNFKVIILTNQSGIARGKYEVQDVELLHKLMLESFEKRGLVITDIFFCEEMEGNFRKPAPGMLLEAQTKYDIDFSKSFMVGDKISDIFTMPEGLKRPETLLVKGNYDFSNIEEFDDVTVCSDHQELLEILREKLGDEKTI